MQLAQTALVGQEAAERLGGSRRRARARSREPADFDRGVERRLAFTVMPTFPIAASGDLFELGNVVET
jgi:hypothetical protein